MTKAIYIAGASVMGAVVFAVLGLLIVALISLLLTMAQVFSWQSIIIGGCVFMGINVGWVMGVAAYRDDNRTFDS